MNWKPRGVIIADRAPAAIGPYSHAIRSQGFVFTSGQIGLIPDTGELAQGGIEAETRQALTNLTQILEASGASTADVLKTTVFLQSMDDFSRMNAVYATFFPHDPPARSTVAVAALPKGARVEIDVVAAVAGQA